MKFLKTFITIFFTLAVLTKISAQEKITLSQAITIALNHNTSIVKSTNSLETTEASLKNAYGNLLPSLNVGGSWNWQHTDASKNVSVVGFQGEAQSAISSETRSYGLSANSSVTLFDGLSNISTIRQRSNDLQAAKYDLEKLRKDVILQTVNLFVTIVNNEKVLKFQQEDVKYNDDMLKKVKEMFDLQMKANVDLYSQEYQTANSQLSFLQAKSNFEKAKITLLNYLSKDVLADYTFELDSAYTMATIKNLDNMEALYQTALDNRNDYQSQKLKLESAGYQLTSARSGYLPSLSGNAGFSTGATQVQDLFSKRSYSVGLSLSYPIFSRWSTEYSVQSAQVTIKNTSEDMIALERQIKSDIKNAVLDLQTAQSQLDVTKTALKSAKETWEIKRDSYALGSATFIDQQQAYRDYVQANNNYIAAESNYIYKQFNLMSAVGLLKTE